MGPVGDVSIEATMSALGHKQTYAAQNVMFALPSKADCAVQWSMSALGQKQTYSLQNTMSALPLKVA